MAGFFSDLGKFLWGGGFWNAGDVARHALGENNVYESYNKQIEKLYYTQGIEAGLKKAEEAHKYALQKKDFLQIARFYIYGCLISNNIKIAVETSEGLRQYIEKNHIQCPEWFFTNLCPIIITAGVELYKDTYDKEYLRIAYEHAAMFETFAYNIKHSGSVQTAIYLLGVVSSYMDMEERYFKIFEESQADLRKRGYNIDTNRIKDEWRRDKLYSRYIG